MKVMKFGGTSVQDAEAISRVISIVRNSVDEKPVVVVSALSKVTDTLYKICDAASEGDAKGASLLIEDLKVRHTGLCRDLLCDSPLTEADAISRVADICDSLKTFIDAVCVVGDLSPRSKARIISRGEVLSSTIICFALNANGICTTLIDAGRLVITTGDYLKGEPDTEEICRRAPAVIEEAFKGMDAVITQGFLSSTPEGETAVLGRGGSDYSASLIGMAIGAANVEIWTDVDGVMTADPRQVSLARSLPRISFEEAAEMAHFGAKVLHPMTIEPAVKKNIPIEVLNSRNPSGAGTVILRQDDIEDGPKSVSGKENILVINIFSPKMINASGFLERVFGVFGDYGVSVDLISTSEASISVTVDDGPSVGRVVAALGEFADVTVDKGKALVSVVGKNVSADPDVLVAISSALRGNKIYMISQGATFINISAVIDKAVYGDAVRNIHKALFE